MVDFHHVTSRYRGSDRGITDVNLHIEEGSFIGLLGPSGAGKSTILKHIIGEITPDAGFVECLGVDPSRLKPRERMVYRRLLGVVPQDLLLLEKQSVYNNIYIILRGISLSQKEAELQTNNVLDIVSLRDRSDAIPCELSGGECQRLAIARALSVTPQLILADEPTGNLDPQRAEEILSLFRRINEMGITVIVATHEWEQIRTLGARAVYIDKGRICDLKKEKAEENDEVDDAFWKNVHLEEPERYRKKGKRK